MKNFDIGIGIRSTETGRKLVCSIQCQSEKKQTLYTILAAFTPVGPQYFDNYWGGHQYVTKLKSTNGIFTIYCGSDEVSKAWDSRPMHLIEARKA